MMAELITKLKRSSSTRAVFNERVAGVADVSRVTDERVALPFPAAYVAFLSEDAEPQPRGANENSQWVAQHWGIVIGLDATPDIRGQEPAQSIETIRNAVFRAIYNWAPPKLPDKRRFSLFSYEGCKLLEINRAVTYWLLTFQTYMGIGGDCDGETEEQFDPLPEFLGINAKIDWIDPHDPGLFPSETYDPKRGPAPWPVGPEGRIESEFTVDYPPTPPGIPRK